MRRYTVDELYERQTPCDRYPRSRVDDLAGEGLTAREIAELDIPVDDRIWAISALLRHQQTVARRIARDVIHLWPDAPPVVHEYVELGDASLLSFVLREVDDVYPARMAERYVAWCITSVCMQSQHEVLHVAQNSALARWWDRRQWEKVYECNRVQAAALYKYLQWAVEALEAEDIA